MIKIAEIQRPYPLGHGAASIYQAVKGQGERLRSRLLTLVAFISVVPGIALTGVGAARRMTCTVSTWIGRTWSWCHWREKDDTIHVEEYKNLTSVRYGWTNLSQGSLFGITRLCRVMPNSDPRDIFVHSCLTLKIDSFSCTLFCANT